MNLAIYVATYVLLDTQKFQEIKMYSQSRYFCACTCPINAKLVQNHDNK